MAELRADWEREREVVSSDWTARLSALTTQLELTNVQRVEFEELADRLRQEVRDGLEDKKIAEKKGGITGVERTFVEIRAGMVSTDNFLIMYGTGTGKDLAGYPVSGCWISRTPVIGQPDTLVW